MAKRMFSHPRATKTQTLQMLCVASISKTAEAIQSEQAALRQSLEQRIANV